MEKAFDQARYINEYHRQNIKYRKMNFNLSKPGDVVLLSWIDNQPEGASNYLKSLVLSDMEKRKRNTQE